MRCNPSYWLLGLLPIAMLSWIAVQFEHESIEADLGLRAQQALSRSGLDWAAPIFNGRDGVVTGRALEDSDPARALSRVRDVWGVRIAHNQVDLVERVERFLWSANWRGEGRLQLAGYVANTETRSAVMKAAQAQFPGARISDDMRIARGSPNRDIWLSGTRFALQQLAQLKSGMAELDSLALSVAGEAATPEAYRSVKSALAETLPRGVSLASDRITPPRVDPYLWSARTEAGRIEMSGYAPTAKLRDDLAARARSVFRTDAVTSRMEIADGAPEAWPTAAAIALDQLALLKSGQVEIRGRDITFAGEATDEAIAERIRRNLKANIPQVYRLTETITAPKPAATGPAGGYVMAIAHGSDGVELSGYVPSEAARAALVDAVKARFPGRPVTDKLEVLAGAPDGWQQCIVAGLAALPRLSSGKAVLTNKILTVTGETDDFGTAETVPADVKAAAGQTCQTTVDVKFTGQARSDLVWSVVHERQGYVELSGEAPTQAARRLVLQGAQRAFPGESINDQMSVVGGADEPWATAALKGIAQLAALRRGEARLEGKVLTLRGTAENATVAERVTVAVTSGLPAGVTGKADVGYLTETERQADQCESLMRATMARGVINFERAKADLTRDSTETLRELADIANACPAFRIEIEGHTDAEGTDERNQRLSDRRAQAVADYLVRLGVAPSRLTTVGYGATRPIADNDTDAGRARNRRIEFVVRPN
jgi:OmpA-OmpF porin, OOP family